MLPRRARLSRERLEELMKTGTRAHGRLFSCVYRRGTPRGAAIIVSKKVAKTSVMRHKIRRRAYAALLGRDLPCAIAFIAKGGAEKALPREMWLDMERIIPKV